MSNTYNSGTRAAELIPETFEVSGKTFSVKRTGKALKRIIALTPDDATADDPIKNVEFLYDGLSIVLVDPSRDPEVSAEDDGGVWHPTSDWLENEVDFMVAQEFMAKIVPSGEAGN